ncbi:hypothetical protein ABT272_43180 [Streptomyces sp900105245]|uniref:Uncharacterized protein n=1 Tax=Streptomyces sp. 900105245 TaxID=3154379 RepID=A0ABV1UMF2_9ACTN
MVPPYDDRYLTRPAGLDSDLLVTLAESWNSGTSPWTVKQRGAYANDLGDNRALIAVSAASNRSKTEQDHTTCSRPPPGTAASTPPARCIDPQRC